MFPFGRIVYRITDHAYNVNSINSILLRILQFRTLILTLSNTFMIKHNLGAKYIQKQNESTLFVSSWKYASTHDTTITHPYKKIENMLVKNRWWFCAVEEMSVCVCERERDNTREYRKNKKTILAQARKMNQRLIQREGESAYVVTFSLHSLTTTTSWERGGDLTTY